MGKSPPDSSRKEKALGLLCRICDRPISTENAKSDCDGNVFHEECYALKVKLQQASQNGHECATRTWKVVAAEVSREQDPNKMTELVAELNQALEEQNLDGTLRAKTDGNLESDGQ